MIDWQPIEQYLNRQRTRYLRDHRGRPAYPLLSMFKAVLLGQWHSLSDPELEHSLITRIDFNLFCRFDELSIPDYSTLCRYRNWLAQDDTLSELLKLINRQLTEKGLKVEKASAAVIDATIIQTAGSKQRQAIEVDEEGQVSGQTTPSKDSDARWTKKNGLYKLGYKQHTRTVSERCNGVFVWAEHAKGRAGDVYRQGSSREPRSAALTDTLYTDTDVLTAAGMAALSDTGIHKTETVLMPVSEKYGIPLAQLGQIWQIQEPEGHWQGVITGITLTVESENGAPKITQSAVIDRYMDK